MLWQNPDFDVVVAEFLKHPQLYRIFLWAPNHSGSLRATVERGKSTNTGWVTSRAAVAFSWETSFVFLWQDKNHLNGLVSTERYSKCMHGEQWRHWEEVPAKSHWQHGLQSEGTLVQAGLWRLRYVLNTVMMMMMMMRGNGNALFYRFIISW